MRIEGLPCWEIRCEVRLNSGTTYVHGKGFERSENDREIRSFCIYAVSKDRALSLIVEKWPWYDCTFYFVLEVREIN